MKFIREKYENIGFRVGNAPKKMFLFAPSKEIHSSTVLFSEGRNKIEIIGDNKQFVAFAIHPDTKKPYEWVGEIPDIMELEELSSQFLKDLVAYAKQLFKGEDEEVYYDDDIFAEDYVVREMDIAEAEEILSCIPKPDPFDYDEWLRIGFALYHQFKGSDDARDLFFRFWEKVAGRPMDKKYQKEWQYKWTTFNAATYSDMPVTMATFIKKAAPQLYSLHIDKFQKCENMTHFQNIIQRVARANFDAITNDELLTHAHNALKRLGRGKFSKSVIQKLIDSLRIQNLRDNGLPDFVNNFCYNTTTGKFIHLKTHIEYPRIEFDLMFSKIVQQLNVKTTGASEIALKVGDTRKINGTDFNPHAGQYFAYNPITEAIVDLENIDTNASFDSGNPEQVLFNTFREGLHPSVPKEYTAKGRKVADTFVELVNHLIDERYRDIAMQWFAFQVQHFGTMRRWALMLGGRQGDGKSLLGQMICMAVGQTYCKILTNNDIDTRFNEWLNGLMFGVIEEYEMSGANGVRNYESIKTYITDNKIRTEAKGETRILTRNFANLMFCSNKDGETSDDLPYFEPDDRRFFYLRTRLNNLEEYLLFKAQNPNYIDKFVDIVTNPSENAKWIRKFLMEYPITDEFMAMRDAPMTHYKAELLNIKIDDVELDLKAHLDTHPDLFDLTGFLKVQGLNSGQMKNQKWRRILQEYQMYRVERRVSIDGERHTFYAKEPQKWEDVDIQEFIEKSFWED